MEFSWKTATLALGGLILLLVLFGAFLLFGSMSASRFIPGDVGYAEMGMAGAPSMHPYGYRDAMKDFAPDVEEREVVHTASMSTEVRRGTFSEAERSLHDAVTSAQGFVLNQNVRETNGAKRGDFSLRIPSDRYREVVDRLKQIGEVQSFQEDSRDITGRVVDADVELAVERERLVRLQRLYNERGNLEDKLLLENAIFDQDRKIKYLEDSLRNLDREVEYSSISVNFYEPESGFASIRFLSFGNLVKTFVESVRALLYFLAAVLPWAIVGGITWWVVIWIRRHA